MGLKLKLERIKKGLTQNGLGQRADIPQYRISLLERGISPKPSEAKRICNALGCKIKNVFPGRGGLQ